ncbi:hypothetical protein ABZ281_00750 [Streptomyces sp. NPDC006265]|uniref:hypothetical protein n=1 Tax=Streptomyces sp. NPDC006265 TaxID=3156740 RepID=UPI0033B06FA2
MTMSDVAAQMVSILISAIGLVIFRLIAKYLPEDPEPVVRPRRKPARNNDSEDDDAQV